MISVGSLKTSVVQEVKAKGTITGSSFNFFTTTFLTLSFLVGKGSFRICMDIIIAQTHLFTGYYFFIHKEGKKTMFIVILLFSFLVFHHPNFLLPAFYVVV